MAAPEAKACGVEAYIGDVTLVAVASPNIGVTKVGAVSITKVLPVPVCEATEVAFPELVIGPVKFALVVLAAATKAVVASAVVLSPAVWVTPMVPVGKVGVPVNVGEAIVAFSANASNTAF